MVESHPKIAVIGAGSFVFSLGLLTDLITGHRLAGSRLVLMDVDGEMAATMACIARRMAQDAGVDLTIEATSDREAALQGADFVTTSVAIQLLRRYATDREVLRRHGLHEINSECGGVGGFSYALRAIPLVLGIARDMERLCPDAWLLNVSNPLPRVISAVTRYTRIRAAGFCNCAHGGYGGFVNIATLLKRDMHDLNVTSAGLNHFSWLLGVTDRWTGEDLLPAVQAALDARAWEEYSRLTAKWWRQYRVWPLAGDSHTGEYFPFDVEDGRELIAHHGDEQERAARRRELREAAAGERPWQALLNEGRAWERPADVIHALATGTRRHLDTVNIPNRGAIAGLPDDAVVEVPAVVTNGEIQGVPIGPLPASIADYLAQVSAAHTAIADAAVSGDRALVAEAVQLDPAITDKPTALHALDELISLHADVLPQFTK